MFFEQLKDKAREFAIRPPQPSIVGYLAYFVSLMAIAHFADLYWIHSRAVSYIIFAVLFVLALVLEHFEQTLPGSFQSVILFVLGVVALLPSFVDAGPVGFWISQTIAFLLMFWIAFHGYLTLFTRRFLHARLVEGQESAVRASSQGVKGADNNIHGTGTARRNKAKKKRK